MPSNIEVKCVCPSLETLREAVINLTGQSEPTTAMRQVDTFFAKANGRLKLRVVDDAEVLNRAYGILGELRKTRYLWIHGQTRIHLDQVEGLGSFMELEVVMKPGQPEADGERIATEILNLVGAEDFERIDVAYIDLLMAKNGQNGCS